VVSLVYCLRGAVLSPIARFRRNPACEPVMVSLSGGFVTSTLAGADAVGRQRESSLDPAILRARLLSLSSTSVSRCRTSVRSHLPVHLWSLSRMGCAAVDQVRRGFSLPAPSSIALRDSAGRAGFSGDFSDLDALSYHSVRYHRVMHDRGGQLLGVRNFFAPTCRLILIDNRN
jgi:hypothetical protein